MKPRTTVEFLDAIRAKHNLPSDYAARKLLGVSRAAISNYRTGKGYFDDDVALKVAELLALPVGYVISCVHGERTKRPEVKAAWHKMAQALAPAIAGVFLAGALGATPGTSQGSQQKPRSNVYHVKSRSRGTPRQRSLILGLLARFPAPRPLSGTTFA